MTVKKEALLPLLARVKGLLEPYAGRLSSRQDDSGFYDLWSEKEVEIAGRRRQEVFFAGLIVQKSRVGSLTPQLGEQLQAPLVVRDRLCGERGRV